jgi:hypothetical protein
MTFAQLFAAAEEHNLSLDNPFINPSDETVKAINEHWDKVQNQTAQS